MAPAPGDQGTAAGTSGLAFWDTALWTSEPHPANATPSMWRGWRRLSSIRDLATERLEGDCVRLGAAATAGVQAVDRGHFLGRELEVEHVDVLRDAAGLGGLRNDRASLLQTPAQHHLGGRLAVSSGEVADDRMVEGAGVIGVAVGGDAADR